MPDIQAWASSVSKVPDQCPNLLKMVARAISCQFTTSSSNERDFGDLNCFFGKKRGGASVCVKACERRVRCFAKKSDDRSIRDLCHEARKLWVAGFNDQRHAGASRGFNWSSGKAQKKRETCQSVSH